MPRKVRRHRPPHLTFLGRPPNRPDLIFPEPRPSACEIARSKRTVIRTSHRGLALKFAFWPARIAVVRMPGLHLIYPPGRVFPPVAAEPLKWGPLPEGRLFDRVLRTGPDLDRQETKRPPWLGPFS